MRTRAAVAALATLAALAATACSYTGNGPLLSKEDLAGETTTQVRDVANFTGVSVGGYADLKVTKADEFSVKVTADANLQEHIATRLDGTTLVIAQDYSFFGNTPPVTVEVAVPHLEEVNLAGSSTASIRVAAPETLRVAVSGSADVDLVADPAALTVDISGSGNVVAHGTTQTATISVSGSGTVTGEDLTAADAKVRVSGSGDVSIRVRSTLDVHVSGSGDVTYFGDPAVTKDISGSGDVHKPRD